MMMETQCLLVVVLLLCSSVTQAEVVDDPSECEQFFLDGIPPQTPELREAVKGNLSFKMICQTYEGEQTFFTLYDTENRIPVYSAFKFTGDSGGSRNNSWKIEPQLEELDKNMQMFAEYKNQASDDNYKNSTEYTRGHLFPYSYGHSQNAKDSTFTLTNIVPQASTFNRGSWAGMEACVKCFMTNFCKNNNKIEGYVVTGAVPGPDHLRYRVNIPSKMWSAFCCYNSNEEKWISKAHMGDNVPESNKSKTMTPMSLGELEHKLGGETELFPSKCSSLRDKTVDKFYPQLPKECQCALPTAPDHDNSSPFSVHVIMKYTVEIVMPAIFIIMIMITVGVPKVRQRMIYTCGIDMECNVKVNSPQASGCPLEPIASTPEGRKQ